MGVHLFRDRELVATPEGFATPRVVAGTPAKKVVFSWNATLEPGEGLEAEARVWVAGVESPWIRVGVRGAAASLAPPVCPPGLRLDADELVSCDDPIEAVELRVRGPSRRPRRLGVTWWPSFERFEVPTREVRSACIPERIAQYHLDPERGGRVCGPSSLTMAFRALGVEIDPLEVAERAKDRWADIYGNWTYLAALAGELGFASWVERGGGPRRLQEHLERGRLAVVSLQWGPGELPEASSPSSAGHLVLAVGVDPEALSVLDPAFRDPGVQVLRYSWQSVLRAWKSGAMVVVGPERDPA